MQCLVSKRFKIPLYPLRSVVLPAYNNVICTTNEGVKYGDYNRVLSNRKAQQLFKKTPEATRIQNMDSVQLGNAPNFNFPFIQGIPDPNNCVLYLPGPLPSNLVAFNNFYVTLVRTSNPNYFLVSYTILYSVLLQIYTIDQTNKIIQVIKNGAYGIINSDISCCKIIYLKPLTILSYPN